MARIGMRRRVIVYRTAIRLWWSWSHDDEGRVGGGPAACD
jgi:hypothetical protein